MGNILAPSGASLFDAIAEGDAVAAVEVLRAHPDLTRKRIGTKKRTLYHYCAASGQVAVLKSLCEHVWRTAPDEGGGAGGVGGGLGAGTAEGAGGQRLHPGILPYINASDQKGLTPLSLACKKGHAQVVAFLLTQGADPWIKDRMMGRTALHHAARANHPECVEAILTSPLVQKVGGGSGSGGGDRGEGADGSNCKLVDYPSNSGYTPLHYAAAAHSREAAAALLRHGADPNARTFEVGFEHIQLDRGSTSLHAAARYQSLDVSVLLLRHWDAVLRRRDVIDPRVVENMARVRPYQMPGVKLNKALMRVLDPEVPVRVILDLYGDAAPRKGRGGAMEASAGKALEAAPAAAPPPSQATGQLGGSTGLNRQDSDSSRLSCSGSGSGRVDEQLGMGAEAAAAAVAAMPPRRHASSGVAERQAAAAAGAAVALEAASEAARTSAGSDGQGRALASSRSGRRNCFLDTASVAPAQPASPFSPKAVALTAAACGGGGGGAAPTAFAAAAIASPFSDRNERDGGSLGHQRNSGSHHHHPRASPPLPVPSFLKAPAAAAAAAAAAAPAAPPPLPGGGTPTGRTRSSAVFPMPPPAPGSPGPQLHRTRSLQHSVTAAAAAPWQLAPSLAPAFGSEGRAAVRQSYDAYDIVSHGGGAGDGGGGGVAAPSAEWAPPEARAPASSWAMYDEPFLQSPTGKHQHQQHGALSARSQSVRDGGAYFGSAAASLPPPSPAQQQTPGRSAGESTAPSGSATSRHDGAAFKPQPPKGGGVSRKSLARALSRKLSSLTAAATGSSAIRHEEVRACSPQQRPAPRRGGSDDGSSGGGGGGTLRVAPAAAPAARGWARQMLSGGSAVAVAAATTVTASRGMTPPPAVRSAF